jgi:hypothetical protein
MSLMRLSREPGGQEGDGTASDSGPVPRPGSWVTFTPMARDGMAWSRITSPQQDARAACLLVTAYIHLFRPDVPLRDLDARAATAIRELEEGAETVMVIDDRHRVDRTGLCPAADRGEAGAARPSERTSVGALEEGSCPAGRQPSRP